MPMPSTLGAQDILRWGGPADIYKDFLSQPALSITPSSYFPRPITQIPCTLDALDMDPSIARLFTANSQWSKAVNKTKPEFFSKSAEGQSPKVCFFITPPSLQGGQVSLIEGYAGPLDRLC